MRRATAWKWALVLLAGCASGESAEIELPGVGDDITKIINGRFTFERPEVGLINWNGSACTATLIRDNVAITAAHCVGWSTNDGQGRPLGSFIVHRDGQQVFRYSFDAHISYGQDFNNGGDTDTDIALLRLVQRVPAEVARPARLSDRLPRNGEPVTLFGYGCGDRNNTGDAHQGRKQKLAFASGRTTNLCPGDSGGPTFIDADGALFHINSAYNTLDGTDLFGDAVAMRARLEQQATAWSGGGAAPPGGNDPGFDLGGQDLSCTGLFECLTACQDEACAQDCGRRTGAEPRRRYDAMVACSQANQCPDMNCVRARCAGQVQACFGDAPGGRDPGEDPGGEDPGGEDPGEEFPQEDPGVPGPGGGLACGDLLQCGQQCAGDQGCFENCWQQADPAAQQAYQALSECYFGNGCQDAQCVQQQCGGEYDACLGGGGFGDPNEDPGGNPGPGNPGGGTGCAEMIDCMSGCQDQACAQNCYFQGDFEAQLAYGALANCAAANLCGDQQCVEQQCQNEVNACFQGGFAPDGGGDPNGGNPNDPGGFGGDGLRCMDIINCFDQCFDDACMNDCYFQGSPEGQAGVDAIYRCAEQAGCQDYGCVEQRCGAELNACF